jgi:hypothetical protein
MVRRDYIMRMVEEFGKYLAAIVGLKLDGKPEEALKKIDNVYEGMIDLDPKALKSLSIDELLGYLQIKKKFNNHYLKMIAELLYEEGLIYSEIGDPISARNVLEKSKLLINYLIDEDSTFSIDWYEKLGIIDNTLSH